MEFLDEPDQMEREILRHVPIGSTTIDAKKEMGRNGFKCDPVKNRTFSKVRYDKNASGRIKQIIYRSQDFLYCAIRKGFIVARRWQAAFVYKNGLITEIVVSTGLVGL